MVIKTSDSERQETKVVRRSRFGVVGGSVVAIAALAAAIAAVLMNRSHEPSLEIAGTNAAVSPTLEIARGLPELGRTNFVVALDASTSLVITPARNRNSDAVPSSAFLEVGHDNGFRRVADFPPDLTRPVAGKFGANWVVIGRRCEKTDDEDQLPCKPGASVGYKISTATAAVSPIAAPPPGTSFWVMDRSADGPTFTFSNAEGLTAATFTAAGVWNARPLPGGTQRVCDQTDGELVAYARTSRDDQSDTPGPAGDPSPAEAPGTTPIERPGKLPVVWTAYGLDTASNERLATTTLFASTFDGAEPDDSAICAPDGSALIAVDGEVVALSPKTGSATNLIQTGSPAVPMSLGWYDAHHVIVETFNLGSQVIDIDPDSKSRAPTASAPVDGTQSDLARVDPRIDPTQLLFAVNSSGLSRLIVAGDDELTMSNS